MSEWLSASAVIIVWGCLMGYLLGALAGPPYTWGLLLCGFLTAVGIAALSAE